MNEDMLIECEKCGDDMPLARRQLGYRICTACSTEIKKTYLVGVIGKSGYQLITRDELKQLDPKRRSE